MEEGKTMDAMPEPMIQHIQSFLTTKESALAATLSRSWHSAWLTRPRLDFDVRNFKNSKLFQEFAFETMQRYQDLNMTIDSFTLNANIDKQLSTELVVKAMKLGATHLILNSFVVLPPEVLHSKTLIRLSLDFGQITSGKVNWERLKSLRLHEVYTDDDHVIDEIFSRCCRSLEELTISSCYRGLFETPRGPRSFAAELSELNLRRFDNLKFLSLENTKIQPNLFNDDFPSRFPCLKDLYLCNCPIYRNSIRITCPSVEHVMFAGTTTLTEVQFDFPRIRKLEYSRVGLESSSLCNKGTFCSEWESHIRIHLNERCGGCNSANFFKTLRNFLWELRSSKIFLYLAAGSDFTFNDVKDTELQALPHVVVENVTVDVPSSCRRAFFEGLYRVCTALRIIEP